MSKSSYQIKLGIDYQEWMKYFLMVNKPNLLQSWAYGEAKAKSQGWKVMRGIIFNGNQPIAMFQVLSKKICFINIVRLNQGPLWLVESPSIEQVKEVFYLIKKRWNILTACFLLLAPNLENTSVLNKLLFSLKFYKRIRTTWNSGLIDLHPSELELRDSLRGNWRRRLKTAEKNNLKFIVSQEEQDLNWLMQKYADYQQQKSFQGTPIPLLQALFKCSIDMHQVWMAFVTHRDERIAGMLVTYYGKACTPLVSWQSDKGRELNTGNFILWNLVLFSKQQGCIWFEQGGIDKNNSDVARFKRGIPSHEYELMGEYFSFI